MVILARFIACLWQSIGYRFGRNLRRRQSDYGYTVPFWIGDDGEKSAVATGHLWTISIRAPLDRAIAAYQTWVLLFRAAYDAGPSCFSCAM